MESLLIFLSAVAFSQLLNKILLKFTKSFGVDSRQAQNLVRWASTSKPTIGGISFFITFLVAAIILLILRPAVATTSFKYLALLISATLAFLIGFADDAYGTHPMWKFLGQIFCGVILIIFGIQIDFFVMWHPMLWPLDILLTLVWVVGIMNSLNMLDNMDAVTTTIALTILVITLTSMAGLEGLTNIFYIIVAIAGSFVGFLFFNWRPAKIYMGDTGSMFIGLILAYVGIMYFWNVEASPDNISHVRKGLIPLLVFLVPIMDTTFVTFARLSRGSSPFVGGRDHLTHNLVRVGVREQYVPLTLGIVSLISGTLALYICNLIPDWIPFYSLIFAIYPICVIGIFLTLYLQGTKIEKMKAIMDRKAQEAKSALIPTNNSQNGVKLKVESN